MPDATDNSTPEQPAKLTPKQQLFVEYYCQHFNASLAARQAGYAKESSNVEGSRLLANANIKAVLAPIMAEKVMGIDEGLARLTDMARGTIEPFVEIYGRGFKLDLSTDEAKQSYHLIKKIGYNAQGPYIELHDSKDAIVKLLEAHGKIGSNPAPNVNVALTLNQLSYEQLLDLAGRDKEDDSGFGD